MREGEGEEGYYDGRAGLREKEARILVKEKCSGKILLTSCGRRNSSYGQGMVT